MTLERLPQESGYTLWIADERQFQSGADSIKVGLLCNKDQM
jgi:hypothetical protein